MLLMCVTDPVCQESTFWLKATASSNICRILTTAPVFQEEITSLNVRLSLKSISMTFTLDVSQVLISPYLAFAAFVSVHHRFAASCSDSSSNLSG